MCTCSSPWSIERAFARWGGSVGHWAAEAVRRRLVTAASVLHREEVEEELQEMRDRTRFERPALLMMVVHLLVVEGAQVLRAIAIESCRSGTDRNRRRLRAVSALVAQTGVVEESIVRVREALLLAVLAVERVV